MTKLVMLCGIPGCGKSTFANKLMREEEFIHLSSDGIREEIYGDENEQGNPKEVFEIMHSRMIENLKEGKSVIYDATNTSRKRRRHVLQLLKKIDCKKEIVYFNIGHRTAKILDARRERQVGHHVIDRMYRTMQIPQRHEGWDSVKIVFYNTEGGSLATEEDINNLTFEGFKRILIDLELDDITIDRPQNNPYHNLSIDRHIYKVYEYIRENYEGTFKEELLWVALLHDVGKEHCRKTKDNLYDSFIGHENVSAQLAMNRLIRLGRHDKEFILRVVDLVNCHMLYLDESKLNKDKKEKGTDLFRVKMLETLRKADKAGH